MIIAVMGLPGSGKSYFATRLAEKLSASYISSDLIRQEAMAASTYSPGEKMRIYEKMAGEMEELVRRKEQVVLDATFYKEHIRNMFIQFAAALNEKILFIEIRADETIIRERLSVRRAHSEADYSVYLKLKEDFEPLENEHLILLSTGKNIAEMLREADKYLKAKR